MLLLLVLACDPKDGLDTAELAWGDLDADGYAVADGDCNDHNPNVHPGAAEACDFLDNDCDEEVDEGNQKLWYIDLDQDGYGDPETEVESCAEVAGYIPTGRDCNDDDPSISPAQEELCDGIDQDCDAQVDEGVTQSYWADVDEDGYGDPEVEVAACALPAGYADNDFDCDDSDVEVRPNATDICNEVDDDCDGELDEDPDLLWYPDDDGDGFGAEGDPVAACSAPSGYAEGVEDCDDEDAGLNPDTVWFEDVDQDGFGGAEVSLESCEEPTGYVLDGDDCDDAVPAVNPDADELCNSIDDDCDGDIDEDDALDAETWYLDADGDGYGVDTTTTAACTQPSGYAAVDGDCDESDGSVNPGAEEVCGDNDDDDCDGLDDESCEVEHCADITTDETWTSESPHLVTCDIAISAELTLEDGAVVSVDEGFGITVEAGGTLLVEGTSAGVTLTSSEGNPKSGDWLGLTFDQAEDSVIEGLTLSYAGGNGYGGILVYKTEVELTDSLVHDNDYAGVYVYSGGLVLQDSELSDNETWGLYLDSASTLDDAFSGNVLTGNDQPLQLHPSQLGQLDATSVLSGNVRDEVEVLTGTVTDDASWPDCGADYVITGDINIQATTGPDITIEDGTVWLFENRTQLRVATSYAGSLTIDGSSTGVTMASADSNPQPGDWDGLYFGTKDTGSSIVGLSLSEGGYASGTGCLVSAGDLSISDSTISDCAGYGITMSSADLSLEDTSVDNATSYGVYLYGSSGLTSFSNNSISNGGSWPLVLPIDALIDLDTASTWSGNAEDKVRIVAGGRASRDGTWPAYDYSVGGSVSIGDTSKLPDITITDGATFAFDYGQLSVGNGQYGTLTINGSSTGVTFTSSASNPQAGDWNGLYLGGDSDGSTLSGFSVLYAGAASSAVYLSGATNITLDDCTIEDGSSIGLYVAGSSTASITDCSISGHASYGIRMDNGALTADFTNNTLSGNGLYPLWINPETLADLDSSSSFTGNSTDSILVDGGTVSTAGTWPLLDASYRVTGDISVNSGAYPHVVVEAGTTWEFESSASLRVHSGSIEAVGTSTSPIVFTSAQSSPSAGDYEGVVVGGNCIAAKTVFQYVTIAYGGGSASGHADANLYWACPGGSVLDSTISYSGGYGIYRWYASPTLTNITYTSNVTDLY